MEKLIQIWRHQQLLNCHFDHKTITSRQSLHESPSRTTSAPEHLCVSIAGAAAAVRLRTAFGKRHPAPREWHWRARNVIPGRRWRKGLSKHARSGGRTEQVGWAGCEDVLTTTRSKQTENAEFSPFIINRIHFSTYWFDLGWSDLKVTLFWFTSIFHMLPVLLKVHMCSWNQHKRVSTHRVPCGLEPKRTTAPRAAFSCITTHREAFTAGPASGRGLKPGGPEAVFTAERWAGFLLFLEYYAGDLRDFVSNSWLFKKIYIYIFIPKRLM